ncbi:hypothetical protein DPMN_124486 [Dreissena polymorpha]|uniref:Uncharacterized protein n=1 Tax=Dreissena polymorpha TaxID=45954 RepID=A0A9D4JSK2_DREPO|nr:hypothetical protein DPMN_124486 [Dreissena polymorpha]
MLSTFRNDVNCVRTLSLSCLSPILSVDEQGQYLCLSCLSSRLKLWKRTCSLFGFRGSFRTLSSSSPNLFLASEYIKVVRVVSFYWSLHGCFEDVI